jgi:hypothetical protein
MENDMQRIIESRNEREGHFAGKVWRYSVSHGRTRSRRCRAGQDGHNGALRERIPPGGWYGDPLGGGWGCA